MFFLVSVCWISLQMNVGASPVNKGPEQQPDGPLNVFGAQPAPLLPHQQTQDVQSHLSQRRLRCCDRYMQENTSKKRTVLETKIRHRIKKCNVC